MNLTFHCPNCGAPLDPPSGSNLSMRCPFCSSSVIIPENLRKPPEISEPFFHQQMRQQLQESEKHLSDIIQLVNSGQRETAISQFRVKFDTNHSLAEAAILRIKKGEIVEIDQLLRPHSPITQPTSSKYHPLSSPPPKKFLFIPLGFACLPIGIIGFVILMISIAIFFSSIQPEGFLYEFWLKNDPNSSLTLLHSFGGENAETALLSEHDLITSDKDGNIYVAEFPGGRIQQFDKAGKFNRVWNVGDGKVNITAIEVDLNGVLYVVFDRTILRFDILSGANLEPFPNPNNFRFNDFKALSDGSFAAMVDGDNLVRLNIDWNVQWLVEEAISSVADETDTRGLLAVDSKNNFYIAGTFVESVFVYSYDGRYLNRIGSEGNGEGQFSGLTAITIDGQNRVLVNDWGNLEIFEPDGRWIKQIQLPYQTSDLDVGPDGL